MKAIRVSITGFIDDRWPVVVECQFSDVYGKVHTVQDKVPIVTEEKLNASSGYPQHGTIGCEIVKEWEDLSGRKIFRVDISKPWGVDTIEGLTEFDVFEVQLIELVR